MHIYQSTAYSKSKPDKESQTYINTNQKMHGSFVLCITSPILQQRPVSKLELMGICRGLGVGLEMDMGSIDVHSRGGRIVPQHSLVWEATKGRVYKVKTSCNAVKLHCRHGV